MKPKLTTENVIEVLGTQPGESANARRALIDYATMGKRSLIVLTRLYQDQEDAPTKRMATIREWSAKYEWQHRVAEFDAALERSRMEIWIQRREQVNELDWRNGGFLRRDLMHRYRKFNKDTIDKDDINGVSKLVASVKTASEMQRLACNEPTQNVNIYGAALDALLVGESTRITNGAKTANRSAVVIDPDPDPDDD